MLTPKQIIQRLPIARASGLWSSLGTQNPLSKISSVGPLLILRYLQINKRCKMNERVNKF